MDVAFYILHLATDTYQLKTLRGSVVGYLEEIVSTGNNPKATSAGLQSLTAPR